MVECIVAQDGGVTWLTIKGRIDGMTSPNIQKRTDDIIMRGERILVVNLGEVNYISSAGLRVFIGAQKQLKKVGGEVIFCGVSDSVQQVFTMSSFDKIFRFVSSPQEIESILQAGKSGFSIVKKEVNGIVLRYKDNQTAPGRLSVIGSQEKLARSDYSEADTVPVKARDIQFGTGLATMGDSYQDYKNYFGEAIVVNRSLYFYPAVKLSAVDFMLATENHDALEYTFLHGFGFSGSYRFLAHFDSLDTTLTLERLITALHTVTEANAFGLVFLGESQGLWGMNLKKIPITENAPTNGNDIFSAEHFSEWFNFPVEPGDGNRIVLGTGIAFKEPQNLSIEVQQLLSKNESFHIHGAVFPKGPLSRKIDEFDQELNRVQRDLEPRKVQHLLGQSSFTSGMVGIIELHS